jgi:hypothetical protein
MYRQAGQRVDKIEQAGQQSWAKFNLVKAYIVDYFRILP